MITVMGLGFVGLTTALGFSYKGFKVYGYDVDVEKCKKIADGIIPFHEPHLKEAMAESGDRFMLVDNLKEAVANSEAIFICVGTPCDDGGNADLSYVYNAIQEALSHVKKGDYKVIVIKSTVPPSSADEKVRVFIESLGFKVGKDLGLASNPEFLREGYAWKDFMYPDRIVIGEDGSRSGDVLEKFYLPFKAPIRRVSLNSAEFIKYLSNTLLSTMISYSNEMSLVAHAVGGVDIADAFHILHEDKRWFGNPANITTYVYPGCGFGGYCLPKDTQAVCSIARQKGYESSFLESVLAINGRIKNYVAQNVMKSATQDSCIGICGLSFKPESDDVRETPAADIISTLLKNGYKNIVAYDPLANDNFKSVYGLPIRYCDSMDELVNAAEHLVIVTAWKEFKSIKNYGDSKKIYDFRYIL